MDVIKCQEAIDFYRETEPNFEYFYQERGVIKDIVTTMEAFLIITIEIQRPTTTLSDFFGFWLILELEMKSMKNKTDRATQMAENLCKAMENRKNKLLDS